MAFDSSDFLAEFGGLMGLLAGISVFSMIELLMTIVKAVQVEVCKSKVAPKTVRKPKSGKKFLVNRKHLLYHLIRTLVELLKASNIHGVHFISDKTLSVLERIFWSIIVCVLMAFSSVMVVQSLKDLQSSAVIVSIDDKVWNAEDVRFWWVMYALWCWFFQVPFPIVSFCPDIDHSRVYQQIQSR